MLIELNESEVVGTTAVFVCLRIYQNSLPVRPRFNYVIKSVSHSHCEWFEVRSKNFKLLMWLKVTADPVVRNLIPLAMQIDEAVSAQLHYNQRDRQPVSRITSTAEFALASTEDRIPEV